MFWDNHDPTTLNQQGNDIGTQYRSAVFYTSDAQRQTALSTKSNKQKQLNLLGKGQITTEVAELSHFYYAEDYHQQYLYKNSAVTCTSKGMASQGSACAFRVSGAPDHQQATDEKDNTEL